MDTTIVKKIISGDIKAFEALFNDYYDRLAYFAYQYLKDKDNAEDVVQELFSKLWVNRQKLSIETSINAYLYSAVRNACLNQLKHQKVKEAYFSASGTTMEYDEFIPNKIDAEDLGQLIQSCIIDLPPERQKIFLLSREQDLKYKEIAEKLGISVKTVEAQMGKALRFLRERLKEYLAVWIVFFIDIAKYF
ncbi:RNA polymerase sigma-70 factor [Marivirga sp. S37H4]|uniref:RNA polymerase sigma-70 factor n=1 Tax=Marivirga aurantiaca TaxID=2802615 RepID=A0A934WZ38_9BACT|nr:RNA polymerase sigma-70 factor [Marivirga aurantiaca]MBK6265507.1 RNA polymerase sigma-70 factor [Marivirga aurantiaca]